MSEIRIARLLTLAVLLLGAGLALGADVTRKGIPDATLQAYLTPGRVRQEVKVGKDGSFKLADIEHGTWTLEVTLPDEFLEKWVEEELEARNWKRTGEAGEGRGERYAIQALDERDVLHDLTFEVFTTVLNTENKGDYAKQMRWQHAKHLSFKFSMGPTSGGVLAGRVEKVLTVD